MTKISNQYSLTNVLFADAVNGRVGIGTTSPSYILDAYSTGASSARINIGGTANFVVSQYTNSSGTMYVGIDDSAGANFTGTAYGRFIYSSGAYPLSFVVNGAERMRITSGGLVGIGTTSPNNLLEVYNSINGLTTPVRLTNAYGAVGANVEMMLSAAGNSGGVRLRCEAPGSSNQDFSLYVTASNSLRSVPSIFVQGSSGNVGIGQTNPSSAPLDIKKAHATSYGILTDIINLNGYFPGYDIDSQRAGIAAGVPPLSYGNTSFGWMSFKTRGTDGFNDRMVIHPDGRVCIGATAANGTLTIKGYDAWISINGTRGSGAYTHEISTSGVNNENLVIIGASYLYARGSSNGVYLSPGSTSWTANSDLRLKNIDSEITGAIDKLQQIRAVKYSWKSDESNALNLGLIAQEVQEVLPEIVNAQPDKIGTLGVRYTELVPVLVAAIKEQQLQINELKALLNA